MASTADSCRGFLASSQRPIALKPKDVVSVNDTHAIVRCELLMNEGDGLDGARLGVTLDGLSVRLHSVDHVVAVGYDTVHASPSVLIDGESGEFVVEYTGPSQSAPAPNACYLCGSLLPAASASIRSVSCVVPSGLQLRVGLGSDGCIVAVGFGEAVNSPVARSYESFA